jgi:putative DNA primase/helicase
MVPDPSWFSDSMPHDLASKDARAHLRGKWFIELPELAQFRRTELAALKGFLTTATDTYRPSYGRHEVTVARQCVFVASTNEDEYLADATGGRRYWPVALAGQVDLDAIRRDRDQLWAEAAEAFGRGEAWWITDKALLPAVKAVQASRQLGDGWDQIVADYVATKGVNAIVPTDFLLDVLKLEPGAVHQKSQQRVGDILKGMGWKRGPVRVGDGPRRKGWQRPDGAKVVQLEVVQGEGGTDPDLIEGADAPRKRDHLKVVVPPATAGGTGGGTGQKG